MKFRFVSISAAILLTAGAVFAQNPVAADSPFQVRYVSNLSHGDSVINITNTGASSTVALPTQDGNICVNTYAFSPDEQLVSCCSCLVTPDGLVSLSARNDLISNTLTPAVPTSLVVKLLATAGTTVAGVTTCNAAAPGVPPVTGMVAWGTSVTALRPGADATPYTITETPFLPSSLREAEFVRITSLCGFIQTNGSGFGVCRSCRLGGLGAEKGN